jgi:hypothetical protein
MSGFEVFNVKDAPYSATGDGTTDDAAAIQAAIDAAEAVNGIVFFPPADVAYLIESTLEISKPLTLLGTGQRSFQVPDDDDVAPGGSQIWNGTTDSSAIRIAHTTSPTLGTVRISDLYIRGNRDVESATGGHGIEITGGEPGDNTKGINGILLLGVSIRRCMDDGIYIADNAFNSTYEHVASCENGGHGIHIVSTELAGLPGQLRFIACTVADNSGDGFHGAANGVCWLFGIQSANNSGWGYRVTNGSSHIISSKVEDCDAGGFYFSGGGNEPCSIRSCTVGAPEADYAVRINKAKLAIDNLGIVGAQRALVADILIESDAEFVTLGDSIVLNNNNLFNSVVIVDNGKHTRWPNAGARVLNEVFSSAVNANTDAFANIHSVSTSTAAATGQDRGAPGYWLSPEYVEVVLTPTGATGVEGRLQFTFHDNSTATSATFNVALGGSATTFRFVSSFASAPASPAFSLWDSLSNGKLLKKIQLQARRTDGVGAPTAKMSRVAGVTS